MGQEETRRLCAAMIERHDEMEGSKAERTDSHKRREEARAALVDHVTSSGGAIRIDAARVLRMVEVASKRAPKPEMLQAAVEATSTTQLSVGAADDSARARLAATVFQHLKPSMWPRVPRLTLSTSCPRGRQREALPVLPQALAPVLRAYEDSAAVLKKRKRDEAVQLFDAELISQLESAGGSMRYSLTVNGERRSATLSTEPSRPCDLLVREVEEAVSAVAERVFADMDDTAVEQEWDNGSAKARFAEELWSELERVRQRKRASIPRRIALRRID